MTATIRREIRIPQPPEQVWLALTDSALLAEWMFPNDFQPRVGHHFTFHVPPNPKAKFDGLVVRCEVLKCEPPRRLEFSWSAGGAVEYTRVTFLLEPDGDGTRILFEHSGFDLALPFGEQALRGAEFGWAKMLKQLADVVASSASRLRKVFPNGKFSPPATEETIAVAESALGVRLPEPLRRLYFECDGFREDRGNAKYLLSLTDEDFIGSLVTITRSLWTEVTTPDLRSFIFFGCAGGGEFWGINVNDPDEIIAYHHHMEDEYEMAGTNILEVFQADYASYEGLE